MILNFLNDEQIKNQMVEQVRDGIVRVYREKITYTSSTDTYTLSSAGSGSVAVYSIESIEGIDNDGFYRPASGSFNGISAWEEGTDYELSGSVATVAPNYAGVIAGDTLYDKLNWLSSSKPEDGTDFLVSYTYFDENKVQNPSRPTSFAPGSISNAWVSAFSTIVGNMYNELENSHEQSFISTATGVDLDLWGEIFDVDRDDASSSTGKIEITNNSDDDLSVTLSNRFTTTGFDRKVFIPTQSKIIASDNTDTINVESVETGTDQNVGVRTITKMYTSSTFATEVADVIVTNPGVINGQTNLFNDGANKESNNEYRQRILNVINKRGTATKSAVRSAINNLSSIAQTKVYDWEDKKSIDPPNYEVFVVGSTNKVIKNPSIDTDILNELENVSPVGSKPIVKKPLGVLVDISGSAYINKNYFSERSSIRNSINTNITNYFNDLEVGHDIIASKIVDNAISINNMERYDINEMKVSEFSFQIYNQTAQYLLYASGTDNPYATQIYKNSKGFRDVFLYDGTNDYTTSGSNINSSFTPTVYIAIKDETGIYVRDPQYNIDWFSSISAENEITIDPNAGSGSNISLTSGSDYLLFNYDSYQNHDLDGVKVLLSGSIASGSATVDVSIWSGSSEPTTKIDNKTISVTSGTSVYNIQYDNTINFDPTQSYHWLVLSGTALAPLSGSGESDVYVVTESANRSPLVSTNILSGSGGSWSSYTGFNKFTQVYTYNYYNSGSNFDITGVGAISEIAVLNDLNTETFIYTGDDN